MPTKLAATAAADKVGSISPFIPSRWDPANPTPTPITEALIAETFAKISGDADVKKIVKLVLELDGKWLAAGHKIDAWSHTVAIATFRQKLSEAVAAADGRKLDSKADYLKAAKQSRHPLKVAQVALSVEAAEACKPLYKKLVATFTEMAQQRAAEELKFADVNDDSPSQKLKALTYAPIYLENQFKKLGEPRNVRPRGLLLGAKI